MTTAKLACPTCGQAQSSVIDTRPHPYKAGVWRKRRCQACGTRFETLETITVSESDPRLIKHARDVNI